MVDAKTAHVTVIEIPNRLIVQENTSGNWYSEPGPSGPWKQIPAITPSIGVTVIATGKAASVSGLTFTSKVVAETTIVVTATGVAKVSVGAVSDKLQFISMSAVAVTAGSAAVQVVLDGGKNIFIADTATMSVTGGSGADAYVYHAGDAMLTMLDFAVAKATP